MGSVQDGWQGSWEDLHWSSEAGTSGIVAAPPSEASTVPGPAGGDGWEPIEVRFTVQPSKEATLVDLEHFDIAQGMVFAGTLTLPGAQEQVFIRGDGANYSAVYGLTRTKPVSVTPRGDTAQRFAAGWTFTTVELGDRVWATAIQLSGMDDSSDGLTSLTWKDAAGTSHTFELVRP